MEPVKGVFTWLQSEGRVIAGSPNFTTVPPGQPKKIFDQFASGEDYGFNKTVVPVKLARYGQEQLVSRSQAKRLLARVEVFKIVIFDFREVPSIGQAFADEIFRVFANRHPEIELSAIHANSEVKRMIERAKSGGIPTGDALEPSSNEPH